ncbi:hypothetical protein QCA50_017243 [Cerrena zonata]|uniref:Uncharacterized protein n=1 Tax=Cerrena zonata TaxID=2478898 RepID=A0AAW0FQY2_9APHY
MQFGLVVEVGGVVVEGIVLEEVSSMLVVVASPLRTHLTADRHSNVQTYVQQQVNTAHHIGMVFSNASGMSFPLPGRVDNGNLLCW